MTYKQRRGPKGDKRRNKPSRTRDFSPKRLTWDEVRDVCAFAGRYHGIAEGMPVPSTVRPLRLPKGAKMKHLEGFMVGDEKPVAMPAGVKLINRWFDRIRGGEVYVWEEPDGRRLGARLRLQAIEAFRRVIDTIAVSQEAHTPQAEEAAQERLRTLVTPAQFKQYYLTGAFIETSHRSGVCYIFRKLAPTVAFRAPSNVLAALCLHPLAYYDGLTVGGMVPTDDVIAHLCMMRGDERRFWARAEQHVYGDPAAML